jgi:hypothetical protein
MKISRIGTVSTGKIASLNDDCVFLKFINIDSMKPDLVTFCENSFLLLFVTQKGFFMVILVVKNHSTGQRQGIDNPLRGE